MSDLHNTNKKNVDISGPALYCLLETPFTHFYCLYIAAFQYFHRLIHSLSYSINWL